MPDSLPTLADLVKINDQNLADIDVSDLLDRAPFMGALFAQPSSNGTDHKYVKEITAPVVGFRAPNEGRDLSKSGDELVTVSLKILDATNGCDVAIADAYKRGGPEAYVARENLRHLRAAFFHAEKQFINGTGNEADGFQGFTDVFSTLVLDNVIDAGGSADLERTSVYLVRTGEDACSAVFNDDAEGGIQMKDTVVTPLIDATGKTFPAYYTPITGWIGLQIGALLDVARIANIGKTAGNENTARVIVHGVRVNIQNTHANGRNQRRVAG